PGAYTAYLAREGFGPKRVRVSVGEGEPHHFRLLPDTLLGYAWPKWVRAGERAEFRVHSPAAYRLDLFRYGRQKELVKRLGWFDEHGPRATAQITPDGDYTQAGVEWNKHGYTHPVHVTDDAECYLPLSFARPEPFNSVDEAEEVNDPIEGRQACHLAPAEWRLLGWLEREGFAYDYYAETQLHAGALDLDAYRVLILSTHPEYWSRDMYQRLKTWVFERGGKLLYLGGNGLNCLVEFLDS